MATAEKNQALVTYVEKELKKRKRKAKQEAASRRALKEEAAQEVQRRVAESDDEEAEEKEEKRDEASEEESEEDEDDYSLHSEDEGLIDRQMKEPDIPQLSGLRVVHDEKPTPQEAKRAKAAKSEERRKR